MSYEWRVFRKLYSFLILNSSVILLASCSLQKQVSKSANENILKKTALQNAHIGISIFDPAANKYIYDYQGDHYFVPASNAKLPTCYAAMKYLGDSLEGIRYSYADDSSIVIFPTGDPSFLHPDFAARQPVLDFLKRKNTRFYLADNNWNEETLGSGWSWNDYTSDYMTGRSAFPLYGNTVRFKLGSYQYQLLENKRRNILLSWQTVPAYFKMMTQDYYILPLPQAARREMQDSLAEKNALLKFSLTRKWDDNFFTLAPSGSKFVADEIPFHPANDSTAINILRNDFGIAIQKDMPGIHSNQAATLHIIHSQPTDSLLRPMMHRSDNFFAEQCLLMVSNRLLGIMNDERIIDTLLKTDFKGLPQPPRWVDGCGLSRYNLFSPRDFVTILYKMKNEFGMERIKTILATGGEGTLSNYYKTESGYIFAKTGTLSGVVCLSGFLYTKKNKLLVFSILVNNHNGSATDIRRSVEQFLRGLRG